MITGFVSKLCRKAGDFISLQKKQMMIYLRLSKEDGNLNKESNSITNQRKLISDFIKNMPDLQEVETVEYCDDGYTGKNTDRPAFQEMLECCKRGKAAGIIIKDFSRLSRDYEEAGNYIHFIFPFLGIRLISVNDHYDSKNKKKIGENLEIGVKTLLNDLYSIETSRNVKTTFYTKASMGAFLGTFAPYGYKKGEKKNKLEIDQEAAKIVRQIFELTIHGYSRREIAQFLNKNGVITPGYYIQLREKKQNILMQKGKRIWTPGMVTDILRNPVYNGEIVNFQYQAKEIASKKKKPTEKEKWICTPNSHDPIVNRETFEAAAKTFRIFNKKENSITRKKSIFSGKILCGYCKHTLAWKPCKTKESYFICTYWVLQKDSFCSREHLTENQLRDMTLKILKMICLLVEDTSFILQKEKKIEEAEKEKRNKIRNIQVLENSKLQIYEKYKKHMLSEEIYRSKRQTIIDKIDLYKIELGENIAALKEYQEQSSKIDYEGIKEIIKAMIEELIESIVFYNLDRIKIIWKFEDNFLCHENESTKDCVIIEPKG